jgi:zinc transporter
MDGLKSGDSFAMHASDGLVCGFQLSTAKPCGREVLEARELAHPTWLHFNLSDLRTRTWLEREDNLPAFAREILLDREPRIHGHADGQGVALVLGDVFHDFEQDPERVGTLRLFFDERRILTARMHPLLTIDRVRLELVRGSGFASAVEFFAHLLDAQADTFAGIVARLAEQVDDTEDQILAGEFEGKGAGLGRARRLMARLRRVITADRNALLSLPARLPAFCDAEQRKALREIIERFEAIAQDLELVQERARLIQEEIANRYGEATNKNLYLLSIVTVVLLPITLITGMLGMNVGGLPFADSPHGFALAVGLMLTAVVGALLLLHRHRVL